MALTLTLPTKETATARFSPLRTVDLLLLGYLGVVSAVVITRISSQPRCWWLLLAHALFLILLVWWQAVPSRLWSSVLHGAYLSYYLIVSAPAFYFAWRGDLAGVRRFILVVIATFVICYLWFIFFPVAGPYYQFPRPASWFTDNTPARLTYEALATGSSYGAAFPSSHVAAALAATLAAARSSPLLGIGLSIPTAFLTAGVVYCQMHYGVDALAGLAVGGLATWLVGAGKGKHERGRKNVSG
jgi:membrane-associated phospholipid phosphatase